MFCGKFTLYSPTPALPPGASAVSFTQQLYKTPPDLYIPPANDALTNCKLGLSKVRVITNALAAINVAEELGTVPDTDKVFILFNCIVNCVPVFAVDGPVHTAIAGS